MASFRVFGPFQFNLGPQGLKPGESTPTFWTTDPELRAGTVTFTAFPQGVGSEVVGADGARLAVRDPMVQIQAGPVAGSTTKTLHVVVVNVGESTVFNASMFISFVEV